MKLAQVEYHLFEGDDELLDKNAALPFDEIDREICLVDSSRKRTYVSWNQAGDWTKISLGLEPFFLQPSPVVRNVSDSSLWRDFVGKNVQLSRSGFLNDTLTITAKDLHIHCCCYSSPLGWGAEVVRVTRILPDRPQLEGANNFATGLQSAHPLRSSGLARSSIRHRPSRVRLRPARKVWN